MKREEAEVGIWVVYRPHAAARPEDGQIARLGSVESGLAHVLYRGDSTPKATRLSDLELGHPSKPKPLDPECDLCCMEPCCPHYSSEYGNCSDCLNTGHLHPVCQPCPNCTDSPGDSVGHVPADDIACSVCGYDIEAAAEAAADNRLFQTGF